MKNERSIRRITLGLWPRIRDSHPRSRVSFGYRVEETRAYREGIVAGSPSVDKALKETPLRPSELAEIDCEADECTVNTRRVRIEELREELTQKGVL